MDHIQEFGLIRATHALKAFARRLSRRTWFAVLGLAGVGAALYAGWGWLAAAGLTTFIVGVMPCVMMCGLGLCANRLGGKGGGSCDAKNGAAATETDLLPQRIA
jgi:hypothetical protein